MLTILFIIMFLWVMWKMIALAFRTTWGIAKVLLYIVFFPLILVGMVVGGLVYIALPILAIAGIVALISGAIS